MTLKSQTGLSVSTWVSRVAGILVAVNVSISFAAYTTIIDSGPSANRVDIVFLGDGYTADNIAAGIYDDHVHAYLDHMFSNSLNADPFYRYRNFFNVHTIEVVSAQSGADVPPEGIFRNTALDAKYFGDGEIERLLTVSTSKANAARNAALADAPFTAEMQFVTVNDTKYGGSGGAYAVFAGGNYLAQEVALHEVAHSFSNLADEYGGRVEMYTGSEPREVNVTKNASGSKWSHWIGYEQPVIGTIGVYEGGKYYDQGLYRPSVNSKMRNLNRPFDAVSREKIILDIYNYVEPFDSWSNNSTPLLDPGELFVELIDEAVISVEWLVNNELIENAVGTFFDLADFGFGPGEYSVTARGYDPTAFDPINGWVRRDQQRLEQFITWDVTLSAVAGDFNGDGIVDGRDFLTWQRDPSIGDLADWQLGYGAPSLVTANVAVPEPSCLLLATVLAAAIGSLTQRVGR